MAEPSLGCRRVHDTPERRDVRLQCRAGWQCGGHRLALDQHAIHKDGNGPHSRSRRQLPVPQPV